MTKEGLKKEAEDFLQKKWGTSKMLILGRDAREVLADFAEPREKQIEIDAKHIRALQKQNGELTDKVNDLEDKLANADYQLEGRDNEIRELEAQIEKMKCCYNCANDTLEPPEVIGNGICEHCKNHDKWELEY